MFDRIQNLLGTLFEDGTVRPEVVPVPIPPLTLDSVRTTAGTADLRRGAIERLNYDHVRQLVDRATRSMPGVAGLRLDLLKRYQYEALLNLLPPD